MLINSTNFLKFAGVKKFEGVNFRKACVKLNFIRKPLFYQCKTDN